MEIMGNTVDKASCVGRGLTSPCYIRTCPLFLDLPWLNVREQTFGGKLSIDPK